VKGGTRVGKKLDSYILLLYTPVLSSEKDDKDMASDQKKTPKTLKIKGQTTSLGTETGEKTQKVIESRPPEMPQPGREEDPKHREFLFRTFHDMRNPLHTIMGYTSLVLRKTRGQLPEKHQENLEKVIQSAERLEEIVDRIVAFYREK
jgi:signal transduction histidine kinase